MRSGAPAPTPAAHHPEAGNFDVVVCGAGPAGVAAAVAAGRAGVSILLVEPQNALGGVWTSGLLSLIPDGGNKSGLLTEIRERLREKESVADRRDLYDAEAMKLALRICSFGLESRRLFQNR